MPETLLSPSGVLLYGRVVTDLTVNVPAAPVQPNTPPVGQPLPAPAQPPDPEPHNPPPRLGDNNFLQRQLRAHAGNDHLIARIARIYGFSYEGHYYDLAKPALFLVHGDGVRAERPGRDPAQGQQQPPFTRVARGPDDADRTGVASTERAFSEEMLVWAYDKGDFSIRLDVETGTFEQILLEVELSADRIKIQYAGQKARLRGDRGPGNED